MKSALMVLLSLSGIFAGQAVAQEPEITFHSSTHLVLVDVVALKNGLPDKTLRREDFQVLDNGRPVSIKTFDSGAQFTTRALALWFVVQCSMEGWQREGSGVFRGKVSVFEPALKFVEKQDTVAVAHWCDDGQSKLDLMPTSHVEEVAPVLEQELAHVVSAKSHDRTGELALQKTLQLMIGATRSSKPEPVPVVIFLYGDYSAMPKLEADHFIGELLETSAVAYGVRDRRSPRIWSLGEQGAIANYIATQTGGEYLRETPDTYAQGLEKILQQLHGRYQLGFQPEALDGKRHTLKVELTGTAKKQHKGVRLRHRTAYVPVPTR